MITARDTKLLQLDKRDAKTPGGCVAYQAVRLPPRVGIYNQGTCSGNRNKFHEDSEYRGPSSSVWQSIIGLKDNACISRR